jgi:hypothetical protein
MHVQQILFIKPHTCAVALNVEATLLIAAFLRDTDTGRVSAATRSWVGILWRTNCDRCDGGEDDEKLHCRVILTRSWLYGEGGLVGSSVACVPIDDKQS